MDEDIIQINKQINEEADKAGQSMSKVDYRFRVPESARLKKRVKNKYEYIGGTPLSKCQVETIPVI